MSPCGGFAAVVNDYGRRGQVLDLRSGRVTMNLDGGDYYSQTVPFSLAFFQARDRTIVIHRSAWNRLDLSDPGSGELLSVRDAPDHEPSNKPPPHYLNYFHGALIVDPTGSRVVDDGWIWHPVGIPLAFSLARWHDENVWESDDGPSRLDLCARNYYWDHAIVWLDDHRVAVAGIGDDEHAIVPGARIFDVARRGRAAPGWSLHAFAEANRAAAPPVPKEVPTFDEWFNGRFWLEWVVGRKNKPTEVRSKESIYRVHLKDRIGDKRLDEIDVGEIARLRAALVQGGELGEKRINNILAVVSKPLKYAAECKVIASAPKVGLFKVERPEIVAWDFAQYARLLVAAQLESPTWYVAVCLAGEAGLRVGEIKALRWRVSERPRRREQRPDRAGYVMAEAGDAIV